MKHLQVVYFPYIAMNTDEIDLGYLKVWNFDRKNDTNINDIKLKEKLEKIFSTHITHHGNVRNIGIIEIPGKKFEPVNQKDIDLIQEARTTLFLASISENNTVTGNSNSGHSMMTSENFDVIYQNFTLEDDYVSEGTGEIVRFSKGGYTLDKIRYLTPSFVPTPSRYGWDSEIFTELSYLKKAKPKVYQRIISSAQIFIEGYYNSNHLSNKARILLFMSAFESIFSIPETQQRKHFKSAISKISDLDSEKKYVNYWDKRTNQNSIEYLTKKGLWAEKFYRLRNDIVHGNKIKPLDFLFERTQSHIDIAVLFFILAVKKQFETSRKSYHCDYEINWENYTDNISFSAPKTFKIFVYRHSSRRLFNQMLRKRKII